MTLSAAQTKCITTAKTPIRCKLVVDSKIGIETSGVGQIDEEVRSQAIKETRTPTSLNSTIWRKKHLLIETKSCIYKTAIKPILAYTVETRPETTETKRILETTETKVVENTIRQRKNTNNNFHHESRTFVEYTKALRGDSPYFIIGATGFLARLILEKLLRTCKVREKKGTSAKERYKELFHPILFGELKKEDPNFLNKAILMEVLNEVNCVFHRAANLRFNEKIPTATYINVRATIDILMLSKNRENLKRLLEVAITGYRDESQDLAVDRDDPEE
ncbi:hypothetical protein ILUMI_02072 [Ignelater luminosus]|uniref:Fatty acyl-CoA reductase n=1 Tax=Ignelater luminosus TaxID=2038154 RepID=A0A8K0DDE1_IGNLU|nr:hypothetical protein ILUMI_02072 [Ignelater luminosus]